MLGLLQAEGIAAPGTGTILIAHDTRPSGPELAAAAAAGARCLGLQPQMCGLLTTPQLHWMVMSRNRGEPAGEADYYAALAQAYARLVAGTQPLGQVRGRMEHGGRGAAWAQAPQGPRTQGVGCGSCPALPLRLRSRRAQHRPPPGTCPPPSHSPAPHPPTCPVLSCSVLRQLYMDCANGVGAPKMRGLVAALEAAGAPLPADLRNTGDGVLNGGCGSDHLQKDRQLPSHFGDVPPGARCCAVDGDSDRLMYFTPLQGGTHGVCWGDRRAGPAVRRAEAGMPCCRRALVQPACPLPASLPAHPSCAAALLFDGDRIACLAAMLVKDLISQLGPGSWGAAGGAPSVGIIQTAYANGAASAYIRDNLGCRVEVGGCALVSLGRGTGCLGEGLPQRHPVPAARPWCELRCELRPTCRLPPVHT